MTVIDKKEAKRLLKAEKEAEKHSMARNLISRRTNLLFNILLIVFCILIIFPLWIIIISSVTSESALTTYGYRLWPLEFSVNAYTYLFRDGSVILTAYKNTLIATFAGTILSVITVGLYSYALSRPDFIACEAGMRLPLHRRIFHTPTAVWTVTDEKTAARLRAAGDAVIFEGCEIKP